MGTYLGTYLPIVEVVGTVPAQNCRTYVYTVGR